MWMHTVERKILKSLFSDSLFLHSQGWGYISEMDPSRTNSSQSYNPASIKICVDGIISTLLIEVKMTCWRICHLNPGSNFVMLSVIFWQKE